jgi:phage shock protein PspC (stress-responsive transcriptional regulator)
MEQTPGQQDPDPSGTSPAGEAPSSDTPASTGSPPPPGWEAPPGGAASPPPWGAVPPSGGAAPPPPVRRLYRLRNDRMVAGVASGLAAHLELDPVWVRLAFVVLAFIGGLGFLLYLVAWVVMPAADGLPIGAMAGPSARRLYRLRNDRWVAGVASGLGAYLEVDANVVRLAFFILAICGGLGVVLYIAAWVLMPAIDGVPPYGGPGVPMGRGARVDLRIIAGAFFLIVAVLVLAGNFDFRFSGLVWGAVLICIGLLFLVGDTWPSRYPAGAPPAPSVPVGPAGYTSRAAATGEVPSAYPPAAPAQQAYSSSYAPYTPYASYTSQPAYATPAYAAPAAWSGSAYRSGGLRLGTVGLAAVVLAVGVALLLQSAGVIHLTAEMGFGIVFLVLGLTLLIGAWFGRSGGLVALGICLLPFAAAAVLVPEPLTGGAGNVSYAPQALSAVQPAYHLAAGQLYVDLSEVDLGGQSVAVTSSVAFGHLVVVVPADTTVDLTGKVGAGEDSLLGRIDSGVQISSRFDAATGPAAAGTLTLNVSVGCGQLTVTTGGVDVQTRAGANGHLVVVTSAVDGRRVGAR